MAASVSASASNHLSSDQPRSGASSSASAPAPAGPLRRLSQLRAYTQSHFLSSSSSSFFPSSTTSHRLSRRNTHSTRGVRSASSTTVTPPAPTPAPATGSEPLPPSSATVGTPPSTTTTTTTTTTTAANTTESASCPESEQQPTLTLDSSVLFSSGLDIDLGFHADPHQSSFSSALLATATEPDDRPSTQGRTMARQRGSSQPPETILEGATPSAPSTLQPGLLDSADPVMTENSSASPRPKQKATIRFYPHQDSHQSSRPSLPFIPISRTLPSDSCVIRVGRYSERDGLPAANPSEPSDAPVGFKSKVVSRKHCEFLYMNGQWHIKDVGSSSGTFLNHMRLSQPNMASRLYTIKDGDIVQLGIDFRGGEEMIFRCVRIRIECNRSWQQQPNEFNKNTESLIRNLGKGETADYSGCRECSICLGSVLRPYQCLFMAACAHVWHYKCVSRLIHTPDYPMFQCPNCRAYTDLSAEVDDSNDYEEVEQKPTTTPEEKKDSGELGGEQPPAETNSSSSNIPSSNTSSSGSNRSSDVPRHSEDRFSTSLPMEAGLAANIENMRFDLRDEPTEAAEESPRSTDPSLTISTTDRSANSDVPGWQAIARTPSAVHCQQAHLRSDTPVRSDSSDENPLTPLNDSGPLAFDGRAGMS